MKWALTAFVFLCNLCAWPQSAPRLLERVNVAGSEYVRLRDWAEPRGLKLRWVKKEDPVVLEGPAGRLELTLDSRKAEINNVLVLLSLPLMEKGGEPLISWPDLQTTLQPILFPKKKPPTQAIKTICLDPGHGGKDTGNIEGENEEKKYTLLLAKQVAPLLRKAGFKVVLTRSSDKTLALEDRPAFAQKNKADLFVSLHYNSIANDVSGLEVFSLSPPGMASSNAGGGQSSEPAYDGNAYNDQNVLLAYTLQKTLIRKLPLEDRGLKHARFLVLRDAPCPAILIEGGFMSDPTDAKRIYDGDFRKLMAQAVVDGILAYQKLVEVKPVQKPPAAPAKPRRGGRPAGTNK